jgi:hypothetical protein
MRSNERTAFSKYPEDAGLSATPADIANRFRETARPKPLPADSLLPAYPVGYILCKDVYIKCSGMSTESREERKHLLEKAQASGGIFCFSYNSASENSKDSSAASFSLASDGMIVRIPGPQILGYVQQILPRDMSTKYDATNSLGKEFYLPPPVSIEKAQNKDNKKVRKDGAAHGIQPPGTTEEEDDQPNQPPIVWAGIRETTMSAPKPKDNTTVSGNDNTIPFRASTLHPESDSAQRSEPAATSPPKASGPIKAAATNNLRNPAAATNGHRREQSLVDHDVIAHVLATLKPHDVATRRALQQALGMHVE